MKGRSARKSGGAAEGSEKDFGSSRADYKNEGTPKNRGAANEVVDEANEKKRGGRAKRKHGGGVKHHEHGKHMGHASHIGEVQGSPKRHGGRSVRASGGRAARASGGSNFSPLSSAHGGTSPRGHKVTEID
jgi:hypothetical protein